MRKLLLALSMAGVAVMGVLMPATASAQTTQAPAMSAAAAEVDAELNFAVAGTPPPKSQMECRSYPAVEICWEPAGDHWWVMGKVEALKIERDDVGPLQFFKGAYGDFMPHPI